MANGASTSLRTDFDLNRLLSELLYLLMPIPNSQENPLRTTIILIIQMNDNKSYIFSHLTLELWMELNLEVDVYQADCQAQHSAGRHP